MQNNNLAPEPNLGKIRASTRIVLGLGPDLNVGGLVHNFLHGVLYEFIERVQLLPNQTLLLKIRTDHRPRVLLQYLLRLVVDLHFAVPRWLHLRVRIRIAVLVFAAAVHL